MFNTIYNTPQLQHIFKVSELLKFDLIYIYHHITAGSKVLLKKDDLQLSGNCNYNVYFKGFKIGSLFVSSFFTALYGQIEEIEAEVAGITKEKYLPIKELDIIVSQSELKLVS
ncbi:MAG: hypothetical protein AB8B72_09690 [Crocinitomicaceae bacterium]